MPVVTSQAWLADKLAGCQVSAIPDGKPVRSGSDGSGRNDLSPVQNLTALVSSICRSILTSDPGLVAAVAAGRTSRQALVDLINRTAEQESLRAGFFREELQQQVTDFLFGYGPLQAYIEDEDISDIDGTGPAEFSCKIAGERRALPLAFPDPAAYDTFCRLVIIRNGGIINENDSHCRVTDEKYRLRINVTVPPRSVNGAAISIRKHRRQSWNLQALAGQKMLTAGLAELLLSLAASDATVVFCGKGAAGKTTLLRAFINALPRFERVLIAESDTEIYPDRPYCLVQRIKKSNEGGRSVSLQDLVADGLTMSLDTYCIGEIVGSEAMDFIRAAFSGHRCLATTHAECAADALDRLLSLARSAARGESDRTLRRMLSRSVKYVVFLRSFRVEQVMEIVGYRESEDQYEMAEIWPAQQNQAADAPAGQPAEPLVPGARGLDVCL